jgi:hypothetical protein
MIFAVAIYLGKEKPPIMTDAEVREVGNFMISKKNVRVIRTSFSQCASQVICPRTQTVATD